MVGVAVPYSYGRREGEGQSPAAMLRHAAVRSVLLIAIAIFLISPWGSMTNFSFTTVLSQIGLGYVALVLLRGRGFRVQAAAAGLILAGTWCLFFFHPVPVPGPAFDRAAWDLPADWPLLEGVAAHWNKNVNIAAAFDGWFLNLFPRPEPFDFEPGGYQTLNFIPSLATMIFGLMAGELLRSPRSGKGKLAALFLGGLVLLAAGLAAGWTVCPIVKRIWTPSWALYSGGWVVWMLAALYGVIDIAGFRRWTFLFVVVGMNSIAMYCMVCVARGWIWDQLRIHFGWILQSEPCASALRLTFGPGGFDPVYLPIVECLSALAVLWLICWWMYRRRIFIRV